jgi:hypothetical protein
MAAAPNKNRIAMYTSVVDETKTPTGMKWDLTAAQMAAIVGERLSVAPRGHFAIIVEFESDTKWKQTMFNDLTEQAGRAMYDDGHDGSKFEDVWVCSFTAMWKSDTGPKKPNKTNRTFVPRASAEHMGSDRIDSK